MASQRLVAQQTAAREELALRIQEVSRPEFIREHVYGSLPEYRGRPVTPEACRVSVVQNDGTGAATIFYETGDGPRVYAKLYASDGTGAAHGAHSYEVLSALWGDGCGPDSSYRVSEPLAFLPDYNALLIRGADGRLVADARDEAELAEGSAEAARWLMRMHRSPVRVGPVRYPWECYHKLMHRLAKAAAQNPGMVDEMIEMSDRFEAVAQRLKLNFVQAHGQFRHIHVFVGPECVTVIDLDRSRPSDPAQDLGEYVHRMRTKMYKATGGASRADAATAAFLGVYAEELPQNLANLPYYWGYHTLVSLWRYMKSSTPAESGWGRMLDFYKSEFECALAYNGRGH